MNRPYTVLVTGASGKTGCRISHLLKEEGHTVIAANRSAKGGHDVQFDWLDHATYDRVFKKRIDSAYLLAPAGVFDLLPAMQPFIDRLIEENVKQIILLSASSLEKDGPMIGTVHAYLEAHALKWTVLRPTWFMQNFSEQHHVQSIREEDAIYSATHEGEVAFISADDIAKVAATALTNPGLPNGDYILTGTEALSYDKVAGIISGVTGRTIEHRNLSVKKLAERYERQGLPTDYAKTLAAMDTDIAEGSESRITGIVQNITGVQPIDFKSFAKGAADAWGANSNKKRMVKSGRNNSNAKKS